MFIILKKYEETTLKGGKEGIEKNEE